MPTRLASVVFDAADPAGLARFWSTATGWPITIEQPDGVVVAPADGAAGRPTGPGLPLVFMPVDDTKVVKNRMHIDLDSRSSAEYDALVERVRGAGATPVDVGQRDVTWTVLADPEGNEFCILEPRADYADAGAVAAVVLDTPDPAGLAPFWAAASGWTATPQPDGDVRLTRPDGSGPRLELLQVADAKVVKNRVHLDVAPLADDDQGAEVERLIGLGATRTDVGQDHVTWVVLADPDGNELCVLSPGD